VEKSGLPNAQFEQTARILQHGMLQALERWYALEYEGKP
jgi:hypothetical protein